VCPEHQKWLSQGKFDGAKLNLEQRKLRDFYSRLLNLTASSDALRRGKFYELQDANNLGKEYNQRHLYAFLRYTDKQQVLVVVNFSADKTYRPTINVPAEALTAMGLNSQKYYNYVDILSEGELRNNLYLNMPPLSAFVFEIKKAAAAPR
jgi:glycosidase